MQIAPMFTEVLQGIVEKTPGGMAGIIMGFDGMALDNYVAQDVDIETVGMEYSLSLKQVTEAGNMLEFGTTEEVSVQTELYTTIIRMVTEEYFVAVTVRKGGIPGKASYLLRVASEKLRSELVV